MVKRYLLLSLALFSFLGIFVKPLSASADDLVLREVEKSVGYICGVYECLLRFFENYPKLASEFVSRFGVDYEELKDIATNKDKYIQYILRDVERGGDLTVYKKYVTVLPERLSHIAPAYLVISIDKNIKQDIDVKVSNFSGPVIEVPHSSNKKRIYVVNLDPNSPNLRIAIKVYGMDNVTGMRTLDRIFWLSEETMSKYVWNRFDFVIKKDDISYMFPNGLVEPEFELDYKVWDNFPYPEVCPFDYPSDMDKDFDNEIVYKLGNGLNIACKYDGRKLISESYILYLNDSDTVYNGLSKYYGGKDRLLLITVYSMDRCIGKVSFKYFPEMKIFHFENRENNPANKVHFFIHYDYDYYGHLEKVFARKIYPNGLSLGYDIFFHSDASISSKKCFYPDGTFCEISFNKEGNVAEERFGEYTMNLENWDGNWGSYLRLKELLWRKCRSYYATGRVQKECLVVTSPEFMFVGPYREYYENGQLRVEAYFDDKGRQVAPIREYYEDGTLSGINRTQISARFLYNEGEYKFFYPNGELKEEGKLVFVEDKENVGVAGRYYQDGILKKYDDKGNLVECKVYDMGKILRECSSSEKKEKSPFYDVISIKKFLFKGQPLRGLSVEVIPLEKKGKVISSVVDDNGNLSLDLEEIGPDFKVRFVLKRLLTDNKSSWTIQMLGKPVIVELIVRNGIFSHLVCFAGDVKMGEDSIRHNRPKLIWDLDKILPQNSFLRDLLYLYLFLEDARSFYTKLGVPVNENVLEVSIGKSSDGVSYKYENNKHMLIFDSDYVDHRREDFAYTVYHEFSHYVMHLLYKDTFEELMALGFNHGGFANPTTGDSFMEGFAEFMPVMIVKQIGRWWQEKPQELPDSYYPTCGPLDTLVYPWDAEGRCEEFAIAGLLWDLYDGDEDRSVIPEMTKYIMTNLYKAFDVNADGYLGLREMLSLSVMWRISTDIDFHREDQLIMKASLSEIHLLKKRLHSELFDWFCDEIKGADVDGDGYISHKEMVRKICSLSASGLKKVFVMLNPDFKRRKVPLHSGKVAISDVYRAFLVNHDDDPVSFSFERIWKILSKPHKDFYSVYKDLCLEFGKDKIDRLFINSGFFVDEHRGNGIYDLGEAFIDKNRNGKYDGDEEFIDYPQRFFYEKGFRVGVASNYERLNRRMPLELSGYYLKIDGTYAGRFRITVIRSVSSIMGLRVPSVGYMWQTKARDGRLYVPLPSDGFLVQIEAIDSPTRDRIVLPVQVIRRHYGESKNRGFFATLKVSTVLDDSKLGKDVIRLKLERYYRSGHRLLWWISLVVIGLILFGVSLFYVKWRKNSQV